MQMNKATFAVN